MANNLFSRFVGRLFGPEIQRRVSLAVKALDDRRDRLLSRPKETFPRDRRGYDRDEVLEDALDAWRTNPLARRIVELTSQYVVGGGVGIESPHEGTHKFLREWWDNRLNRMNSRCFEWCDELSRSGNLFIIITTDPVGMSYVRAIPAFDILEIETAENDVEQEMAVIEKPTLGTPGGNGGGSKIGEGRRWEAYDGLGTSSGDLPNEDGEFPTVILHYAVNRPVGGKWGESDLGPLLSWLSRYAAWLEDRARLNRYRNTFLFWVKAHFNSAAERQARQAELNANPPSPGSILLTDDTETWSVLSSNLQAFEAGEDGLALKKMVAVGSGNPLHFLAEPEGATRTTAESAGGPTFRHYEQRQEYFLFLLEDLARIVVSRRAAVDRHVSRRAEISLKGTDISARDNAALATAATTIAAAFTRLRSLSLIDDAELLRMVYRFCGEVVDVEEMLARGKAAPEWPANPAKMLPRSPTGGDGEQNPTTPDAPGIKTKPIEVDPITGEPTGIDR